jgi:hypothetical protein
MWYRLLNCGFRVAISAGTDAFTNVVDHYVAGANRVYVRIGPKFDYASWLDGFRRGRSFASNGPIVQLSVNEKLPGDEIRVDAPGEVSVRASVSSQVPLEKIELIVNGRSVHSITPAGNEAVEFAHRVPIERSSWIALRALGPRHRLVLNDTQAYAHTSPVYVTVANRPIRVADDVRFYREWVERLITRTEKSTRFANAERKAEVVALFRKALVWYQTAESGLESASR